MADRRSLFGALLFGVLVLACFFFALMIVSQQPGAVMEDGPRVGVVSVSGMITDSTARRCLDQLRKFRKDKEIQAIVVRIASPGGLVGPSQEIYREVERTKKTKPVVASLGSVAASGGYYIAAACSKVVSSPGSITGSIGVITESAHVQDLLALAKVQVHTFASGKFKDTGSPVRPMRDDEKSFMDGFVQAIYQQFLADVAKGRKLPLDQVRPVADGRVLTGQQAKQHKLVDQLGNFSDALALAVKLAGAKGEPVPVEAKGGGGMLSDLLDEALQGAAQAVRNAAHPNTSVQVRDPAFR